MTSDEKLRLECLKLCYVNGRPVSETIKIADDLKNYVRKGKRKEASLDQNKTKLFDRIKGLVTRKVNNEPIGQSESR